MQASYGSAEDARLTYRHIQNQHLGVTKASFYVQFAEFERQFDVSRAVQVLRTGIDQNALPLQDMLDAIKETQSLQRSNTTPGSEQEKTGRHSLSSAQIPKLPSASTLAQSKKRKPDSDTSPKRLKMNDGTAKVVLPLSHAKQEGAQSSIESVFDQVKASNGMDDGQSQSQSAAVSNLRPKEKVSFAQDVASDSHQNKGHQLSTKTPTRSQLTKESVQPSIGSVSILKSSSKKPLLITKTPRLARVGLSGKPMRVNAEENPASDSDSSMDTATQSETIDAKLLENIADGTSTNPVPKITKMDLSYMLNWDPNARRTPQEATKTDGSDKQASPESRQRASSGIGRKLSLEKIEEAPSNGSSASLVTSTLTSVHSNATKSVHCNESQHSDGSDGPVVSDNQKEMVKERWSSPG